MPDRIAKIAKLLAQTPDDVFLHYSLAMELCAAGRLTEADAEFARCIELDAAYLPAYVEGGKCLRQAGRLADARTLFQRGLSLAAAKGDGHAQDFIRQQLESLPA